MIKAVLFDYGGVLGSGSRFSSVDKAASRLYGPSNTDAQLRWPQRLVLDFLIVTDKTLATLRRRFPRLAGGVEKFLYSNLTPGFTFKRNERVRGLAVSLKAAGIRTGVLSNVFEVIALEHKRRGDYDGFDPILLSCDAGMAKPDLKFYNLALEKLKLPAEEILFIDDKKICLVPARHLGMKTILAKSQEQIISDVISVLKRENNFDLDMVRSSQRRLGSSGK